MKFTPTYKSLWDRNPGYYFVLILIYGVSQIIFFWLFFNSKEFWILSGGLVISIGLSFYFNVRHYKYFCTRIEFLDAQFEIDYRIWGKEQKTIVATYSDVMVEIGSVHNGGGSAMFKLRFKQGDIRCDIVTLDDFWTKERFWTVVHLLQEKNVVIHQRDSMFGIYMDEIMAELDLPCDEE